MDFYYRKERLSRFCKDPVQPSIAISDISVPISESDKQNEAERQSNGGGVAPMCSIKLANLNPWWQGGLKDFAAKFLEMFDAPLRGYVGVPTCRGPPHLPNSIYGLAAIALQRFR